MPYLYPGCTHLSGEYCSQRPEMVSLLRFAIQILKAVSLVYAATCPSYGLDAMTKVFRGVFAVRPTLAKGRLLEVPEGRENKVPASFIGVRCGDTSRGSEKCRGWGGAYPKEACLYGDLPTSALQVDRRSTKALIARSFSSTGHGARLIR